MTPLMTQFQITRYHHTPAPLHQSWRSELRTRLRSSTSSKLLLELLARLKIRLPLHLFLLTKTLVQLNLQIVASSKKLPHQVILMTSLKAHDHLHTTLNPPSTQQNRNNTKTYSSNPSTKHIHLIHQQPTNTPQTLRRKKKKKKKTE
ncbi:hypothetical protein M758_1G043800, partial [Ceratodon purpureus]